MIKNNYSDFFIFLTFINFYNIVFYYIVIFIARSGKITKEKERCILISIFMLKDSLVTKNKKTAYRNKQGLVVIVTSQNYILGCKTMYLM